MDRRSDNLPLALFGGVLGLFFMLHTIWSILLEDWLKHQLEHSLSLSEAEIIERFGELGFPILGGIAVVWFLYKFLSKDFSRQLAEATAPQLSVIFDDSEGAGCDLRTNFQNGVKSRFFRLRFTALSNKAITNCSARLVSLKRDDREMLAGETIRLFIAPAERPDPFIKDVSDQIPEYADVLAGTEHNQVMIRTNYIPNSIELGRLFKLNTRHQMRIVFSSPGAGSVPRTVEFFWTGNWETATMRQIA